MTAFRSLGRGLGTAAMRALVPGDCLSFPRSEWAWLQLTRAGGLSASVTLRGDRVYLVVSVAWAHGRADRVVLFDCAVGRLLPEAMVP